MIYAGIGSRETPPEMLEFITRIAKRLAARGFTLRSGGATGADTAFAAGAGEHIELYIPWSGFNGLRSEFDSPSDEAFGLAQTLHPAWHHLSNGARKLMARNTHQILGTDLNTPSDFVVCWTPDGCESTRERTYRTGGTGQAITLASNRHIPVFNLHRSDAVKRLAKLLEV